MANLTGTLLKLVVANKRKSYVVIKRKRETKKLLVAEITTFQSEVKDTA
jgi:hypothetical protein